MEPQSTIHDEIHLLWPIIAFCIYTYYRNYFLNYRYEFAGEMNVFAFLKGRKSVYEIAKIHMSSGGDIKAICRREVPYNHHLCANKTRRHLVTALWEVSRGEHYA